MNARRRPRLVRLPLPADGMDRSLPRHRALDRGRPPRAHEERQPAAHGRGRRAEDGEALPLADDRLVDRRAPGCSISPTRRRWSRELATLQAPLVAYMWIGILTFTTYSLAGYMREQVCLYMCPWPRIQAALTDEYAFNVTYRFDRGEPRMSAKKAAAARLKGEPAGDCVDCNQCVVVCPTGVDIRERPEPRLHPVRALHRCLRHRHGQDRPAAAAHRLRYRRQHPPAARGKAGGRARDPARARSSMPRCIVAVGGIMLWSLAGRTLTARQRPA